MSVVKDWRERLLAWLTHPLVIAGVWCALTLVTMIWAFGFDAKIFITPDESVVRLAAETIAKQGNPIMKLPFVDVEDLAHPRAWLSIGDTAIPVYAPVALYAYGFFLRGGRAGVVLITLLPALATGAFAAGTALLLPRARRALAYAAPALGFASWYWLMRPWMNLSPTLACLCLAFCLWALWRRQQKFGWFVASSLALGLAAAVRPDYAAFLMLWALALLLATEPRRWKWILGALVLAGVVALTPNLILNRALTGHAFRAAYQLAVQRQYGNDGGQEATSGLAQGLSALRTLLLPMGLPTFAMGLAQFKRYFLELWPVPLLLAGQLALIPLARRGRSVARVSYASLVLLVAFFLAGRLHGELFGGALPHPVVSHSVPRYLAPVFLFAALPPILWLGSIRSRSALVAGSLLVAVTALWSMVEVGRTLEPTRAWLAQTARLLSQLNDEIPPGAMVYSSQLDKVLWSRWRVGSFDEPAETAESLTRAVHAELPVFVLEPIGSRLNPILTAARRKGLVVHAVNARRGLYRISAR